MHQSLHLVGPAVIEHLVDPRGDAIRQRRPRIHHKIARRANGAGRARVAVQVARCDCPVSSAISIDAQQLRSPEVRARGIERARPSGAARAVATSPSASRARARRSGRARGSSNSPSNSARRYKSRSADDDRHVARRRALRSIHVVRADRPTPPPSIAVVGSTTSMPRCGTRARSSAVGFAVPMSKPR